MNLKGIFQKFKIFMWYLITEPFRELLGLVENLSAALDKLIYWAYIFLVIAIFALLIGQKWVASGLLILLLIIILSWEWKSGYFVYRYRMAQKKKIKRVLEEKEERLMRR